jgi:hypothetical protein
MDLHTTLSQLILGPTTTAHLSIWRVRNILIVALNLYYSTQSLLTTVNRSEIDHVGTAHPKTVNNVKDLAHSRGKIFHDQSNKLLTSASFTFI